VLTSKDDKRVSGIKSVKAVRCRINNRY